MQVISLIETRFNRIMKRNRKRNSRKPRTREWRKKRRTCRRRKRKGRRVKWRIESKARGGIAISIGRCR